MKYVIVTTLWCESKGIQLNSGMRKNVSGTKVILHYEFIKPVLLSTEDVKMFEHDDPEIISILDSGEWTISQEP